jgi:hypothetical protein
MITIVEAFLFIRLLISVDKQRLSLKNCQTGNPFGPPEYRRMKRVGGQMSLEGSILSQQRSRKVCFVRRINEIK